jgi:hypothetical protein
MMVAPTVSQNFGEAVPQLRYPLRKLYVRELQPGGADARLALMDS